MIVAGLDMATKTGVCLGEPGQKPMFWTEGLGEGLPHEQRFSQPRRFGVGGFSCERGPARHPPMALGQPIQLKRAGDRVEEMASLAPLTREARRKMMSAWQPYDGPVSGLVARGRK